MLVFKEETHQYFNGNKELISATTLMRKHHLAPDYSNVPMETLRRKAVRGSLIHKEIEMWLKYNEEGFTAELYQFIDKLKELGVKVVYSEKMVCNDIVAGTIDLVFENKIIGDIKTTYDLHTNSVRWQLSIYVYLLDKEHYKEWKGQVWHFNRNGELNVVDLDLMPYELVNELFECERKGEEFKISDDLQEINDLIDLIKEKEILELKIEELKNKINPKIKALGQYKDDRITISYKPSSVSIGFDESKFKEENEEIWKKYQKETNKKESWVYRIK